MEILTISKESFDAVSVGSVLIKKNTTSISHKNCVRMRVSSKHLVLASSYFKRNLENGMLESHILSFEDRVNFFMNDEDFETMFIVINVIHGRRLAVG